MRFALLALICTLVGGCVDTTLDVPSNHPANPTAFPTAPAKPPPALMAEFDPFVAYEAVAPTDANLTGEHEHSRGSSRASAPAPTESSNVTHGAHDHGAQGTSDQAAPAAKPRPSSAGSPAGHDHGSSPAPAAKPSDQPSAGDPPVYTCPMHPEIMRNAPGNCPICGMKLVPKKPAAKGSP